jgi:hypothetical protein
LPITQSSCLVLFCPKNKVVWLHATEAYEETEV